MRASQLHYLPLSPIVFFVLVALVVALVVLIQVRVLRYAYERLGLSPPAALLLLLGSLLGSAINIPVAELPDQTAPLGTWPLVLGMEDVVDRGQRDVLVGAAVVGASQSPTAS